MGMTETPLTIKNPNDPTRAVRADFLVDSGSFYTVIPATLVRKLRLTPDFSREFTLADGKKIRRNIGHALVRFRNDETALPVILGERGDSALFGALTLEAFGLALDPFQRKIYRAKMML